MSHCSLYSLKMSFSLEQPFPTCAYSVHGLILGKPQLWNILFKYTLKSFLNVTESICEFFPGVVASMSSMRVCFKGAQAAVLKGNM